jgi:hypothetical protein
MAKLLPKVMKLPSPRTMLMIDFVCALSGGILYFFLFDFLLQTLGIPHWMAMVQLIANSTYGILGVLIFLGGKERMPFLKLITMNFIYAVFCLILAVYLCASGGPLGTWLLFAEGIFIFLLALLEKKSLQRVTEAA